MYFPLGIWGLSSKRGYLGSSKRGLAQHYSSGIDERATTKFMGLEVLSFIYVHFILGYRI